MKIKTNLPKAIIYKEPDASTDKNSIPFKPNALPSSDDFIKVIYEGGYFVAIGKIGTVAYSENGDTWTVKKLGDNYTFNNIEYIKDEYVIVGNVLQSNRTNDGLILTSSDLMDWNVKEVTDDVYQIYFYGIMYNGVDYILSSIIYNSGSGIGGYNAAFFKTSDFVDFTHVNSNAAVTHSAVKSIPVGNNRIGLMTAYDRITYTVDGVTCDTTTISATAYDNIFFYDGYFTIGINSSGYLTRSINLKEWGRVDIPNWGKLPTGDSAGFYIHSALHINDYSLYIAEREALIVRDNEDVTEKKASDIFSISDSTIINSAANSDKKIVCVGNGGIIFTANVDISDKSFTIEPSTVDSEIYLRVSDNIRLLNVKSVTSRIDENIKPENIKAGVTILGVTGTHS